MPATPASPDFSHHHINFDTATIVYDLPGQGINEI